MIGLYRKVGQQGKRSLAPSAGSQDKDQGMPARRTLVGRDRRMHAEPCSQVCFDMSRRNLSCLLEGMKQVIVSYSSYQTVQDGITFLWRLLEKFLDICSLDSGWVEGSPWFVTTLCQSVLFLITHGVFCAHSFDPLAPSPLPHKDLCSYTDLTQKT